MWELPISRDDIRVSRDHDGGLRIGLWIDKQGGHKNVFEITVKGEAAKIPAIEQLFEKFCKTILGITEHDLIMKVNQFFETENKE
jgi:hypothetical protein